MLLPAGGSIFLFDRKSVRFFRKDGHNWRKKADGKTVRETHEKLKVVCMSSPFLFTSSCICCLYTDFRAKEHACAGGQCRDAQLLLRSL